MKLYESNSNKLVGVPIKSYKIEDIPYLNEVLNEKTKKFQRRKRYYNRRVVAMNEITAMSLLATFTIIMFSVIIYFVKKILDKVENTHDLATAQKQINKIFAKDIKELDERVDKIESKIY